MRDLLDVLMSEASPDLGFDHAELRFESPAPPTEEQMSSLVVGGEFLTPPTGLDVRNHLDPGVHHFKPRRRPRRGTIDELVIHETGSTSVQGTIGELEGKGASVHLIVGPDGRVTQHADLRVRMGHGVPHNKRSVGIEIVNPYRPSRLRPSLPWKDHIAARWASGRRYVLPTRAQAEAVSRLIGWLTSAESRLSIPRIWIGESGRFMAMNLVPGAGDASPGIYAHTYYCPPKCDKHPDNPCRCKHADGAWPVLYSWLRLQRDLRPAQAYREAADLAEGVKRRRIRGVPGRHPVRLPSRPGLPSDPLCVQPHLRELELELEPELAEACVRAPVASVPTPGKFYTLKRGVDAKGLFHLAGRPSGRTRLKLAQRINNHPYNHRFWRARLASRSFPKGRVSFSPRFTGDIDRQARARGAAPAGHAFATLWIPPRGEE